MIVPKNYSFDVLDLVVDLSSALMIMTNPYFYKSTDCGSSSIAGALVSKNGTVRNILVCCLKSFDQPDICHSRWNKFFGSAKFVRKSHSC